MIYNHSKLDAIDVRYGITAVMKVYWSTRIIWAVIIVSGGTDGLEGFATLQEAISYINSQSPTGEKLYDLHIHRAGTSVSCKNCPGLRWVYIPDGVKTVGDFRGCTNLVGVTMPDSVERISNYAFNGCANLQHINRKSGEDEIPNSCPESLEHIGNNAFQNCTGLSSLSLDRNLIDIGDLAFYNSGLLHIRVPDNVEYVGTRCFGNCTQLLDAEINAVSVGSYVFENCTSLSAVSAANSIGAYEFKGCTSLSTASLSGGYDTIPTSCFEGCVMFGGVSIPASVTKIGNNAFKDCTSLSGVFLPNGITTIGGGSFRNTGISSIIIPASITNMGGSTIFAECESMTEITILKNRSNPGIEGIASAPWGAPNRPFVIHWNDQDQIFN